MGNPAQPDANAEVNWPAVRRTVADWLARHHARPARLAELTGLNRSIISRFLAGKPLDHASALRVYLVIQPSLDLDAKLALLEAMGLLPLALSLRESLTGASSTGSVMSPVAAGVRLMATAYDLRFHSALRSISLFRAAEKTFRPRSEMAVQAGIEIVLDLITLGDFDQAEIELARVSSIYDGVLGADTQAPFTVLRGWIHFGRRDMRQALPAFSSALDMAQQAGDQASADSTHLFLGMIYTRMGRQSRSHAEAERLYATAEQHVQASLIGNIRARRPETRQAFDYLRLAELRDAQGQQREAIEAAEHMPAMTPADNPGQHHANVLRAGFALIEGETHSAARLGEAALEDWSKIGYAQGMARSARTLAIAALQEGRAVDALEAAIAGVCFNPWATHGPNQRLRDLAVEVNDDIIREMGRRQHATLLQRIADRYAERRGCFAHVDHIVVTRDDVVARLMADLGGVRAQT